MPTDTAATPRHRGEGLIYTGSLIEFHGAVVLGMGDCECAGCAHLEPWAEERRVTVTVRHGGQLHRLDHARLGSFTRP